MDLSANYIEWTKRNFQLNSLNTEQYQFYAMEALEFLRYAKKRGLHSDLIVCDPPSFGRHNKKVFRIDKDYADLISDCLAILSKGGQLAFSSNYEKWDWEQWHKRLSLLGKDLDFTLSAFTSEQRDFERDPSKSLLKAFHMTKK